MKSYNELYLSVRNTLKDAGIEACSQEARYIVAKASGKTVQKLVCDLRLYTSPAVEEKALMFAERRIAGEPIAYILGEWEFYGLPITVTPDVLIPRVDTELMIDAAKELLIGKKMDARILDLCCGSGCIACAIGHEMPATHIVAVDISAAALEVCKKNAEMNRLSSRITFMQADALSHPPFAIGQFDMILCNPPYIKSEEIQTLDPSVKDYEPIWALDGGEDGYKFYKAVIKYWKSVMRRGAYILFEVGEGQAETVSEMLLSAGFRSAEFKKDSAGTDRLVIGKL